MAYRPSPSWKMHVLEERKEGGIECLARRGLSSMGSFLWPYIIPANIPLGIQYYHLLLRSALFEASCREHNEVSKAGSSQPFQSLIAVVVLASNSSHANTARSILGMAKYGQINVRANLTTPSRLYHITLLENDPKNVSFLLLQNNFTPHKWDIKNICPSLIGQ